MTETNYHLESDPLTSVHTNEGRASEAVVLVLTPTWWGVRSVGAPYHPHIICVLIFAFRQLHVHVASPLQSCLSFKGIEAEPYMKVHNSFEHEVMYKSFRPLHEVFHYVHVQVHGTIHEHGHRS